jgi:hypothetical protein
MGSARLLDAHDPSSWPLPVKLVGVGNRIVRIGAGHRALVRWAWTIAALPVASIFWAVGLTWLRVLRSRSRDRARQP